MNHNYKWIISIGTSLSLGLAAAAVSAHPGQMGAGMGTGAQGGPHQFSKGGMAHDEMRHGGAAPQAAQLLMTPEERTALQEKMRSAKTAEERQRIATATRAEMEKRAKEKGITLPEHRGRHGTGPKATAPATTEHVH